MELRKFTTMESVKEATAEFLDEHLTPFLKNIAKEWLGKDADGGILVFMDTKLKDPITEKVLTTKLC